MRELFVRLLDALAKSDAELLEALVRTFAREKRYEVGTVAPKQMEQILKTFKEHAKAGRGKEVEDVLVELIAKVRAPWLRAAPLYVHLAASTACSPAHPLPSHPPPNSLVCTRTRRIREGFWGRCGIWRRRCATHGWRAR
jgi:hypothetical protein